MVIRCRYSHSEASGQLLDPPPKRPDRRLRAAFRWRVPHGPTAQNGRFWPYRWLPLADLDSSFPHRAEDPLGSQRRQLSFNRMPVPTGLVAVEDLAASAAFEVHGEPLVNPRMGSLVMPSRWPGGSCWQGWLVADLRGIWTADG